MVVEHTWSGKVRTRRELMGRIADERTLSD